MIKKAKMTLEKLAQITANGFTEVNGKFTEVNGRFDKVDDRFDKMDKKLDGVKTELKANIAEIYQDNFRQERILMAEVERNDHQDTQIKQLETKV